LWWRIDQIQPLGLMLIYLLLGVLDQINAENKKGVIMGDMNIDMLKYGPHGATYAYVSDIFRGDFFRVF